MDRPRTTLKYSLQNIRNLCSGYSYCVSILDQIYVWHGCGSTPKERNAARDYAQACAVKGTSITELREGDNDVDDEMFWMVLGDSGDYAKADYWRFRNASAPSDPRCWIVDVTVEGDPVWCSITCGWLTPDMDVDSCCCIDFCRDNASAIGVHY
jgi:hypothetical protein